MCRLQPASAILWMLGLGFRNPNPNPTSHEIVAGWHSRGVRLGLDNLGLGVGSGLPFDFSESGINLNFKKKETLSRCQ